MKKDTESFEEYFARKNGGYTLEDMARDKEKEKLNQEARREILIRNLKILQQKQKRETDTTLL